MKKFAFLLLTIFYFSLPATAGNETNTNNPKSSKIISSTFSISSMHVSRDGMLHWTSKGEDGSLIYYVEQYIFDRWVRVGYVNGIGTSNANSYSYPVVFHNGENKFRVRQRGEDRVSRYSDPITHKYKTSEVSFKIINHNQLIEFSSQTFFMIYDPYGDIIDQGYATHINISDFEKGKYCLVYDNKLDTFEKKKVLLKNTAMALAIR